MIAFPAGVRVYLAMGPTGIRKVFDGLSVLAQNTLKQDPFSWHLFGFAASAAIWSRSSTGTSRASACSPNDWRGAASSGRSPRKFPARRCSPEGDREGPPPIPVARREPHDRHVDAHAAAETTRLRPPTSEAYSRALTLHWCYAPSRLLRKPG